MYITHINKVMFGICLSLIVCTTAEPVLESNGTTTEKTGETTLPDSQYLQPLQGMDHSTQPLARDSNPVIERSSIYHPTYSYHHEPSHHGFWKKKMVWRPRWVKTWQEKKVYMAVWKRMWGPLLLNEWVPIPKPPPGWVSHHVGHGAVITSYPHHN